MLTTKNIITQKHARVFISSPKKGYKITWILFHGYAQNIDDFFGYFETFKDEVRFIIPEGLSRFYQKGMNGKVGSSWMTSEEREFEILDQFHFLNNMLKDFKINVAQTNVFAFSQGAATASRWINQFKLDFNKVCFWSGIVDFEKHPNLNPNKTELFIGDNDRFIDSASIKPTLKSMIYEGGHFFTTKLLQQYIFKQ